MASNLRLALIETQDLNKIRQWTAQPGQYSNRASSLTPTSRRFLQDIEVWSLLDHERVEPYQYMQVWDGLSSRGRITFDGASRTDPIAYMTENQNLTHALLSQLDNLGSTSIFDKTSVANIQLGPPADLPSSDPDLSHYPHITLSSQQTLAARLLVGADGINGPVRTFAGTATRGYDYDRHGVVATLKLEPAEDRNCSIAYQRFLPTGPVALLPLPDDFATLVWTTTPERAAQLKSLGPDDFVAMVNAAFRLEMVDIDFMSTQSSGQTSELEWRLSVHPTTDLEQAAIIPRQILSVQDGSVASFPLRIRQATTYTADRIALIGDAAHTIHPLAGQGLNMGLSDSQALVAAIEGGVEHGADIGNELQCLDRYNSETWMRNSRMLGIVDKLHWLYSTRNPVLVGARGFGLGAVERLGGVKHWLMRQAGAN